jgi:ribose transport system permease protein
MIEAVQSPLRLVRRAAEQGVLIPTAFLVALLVTYGMQSPRALNPNQLKFTLLNASLPLVLAAAGLALVVLVGGLDLSSGGVIAAVNAFLTVQYGGSVGTQAAWIVGVVLISAVFGAINGTIVHRFALEPVVVTLATGFILTGAALLLLPTPAGLAETDGPSIISLITSDVAGVPISLVLIVLVGLGWVGLRQTRLGSSIVAVGSDADAAAYTGVAVGRTRILAFALAGALYGLAGVAVTSQTSGGDSQLGAGYLLAAFAAVVVGGVRLGGGFGSLIGVILGAMALTISVNVLLVLGFGTYWTTIVRGLLLVVAIGAQAALGYYLHRSAKRSAPAHVEVIA